MKQRITVEQLRELNDEQKVKLNDWWNPDFGDLYAYEGDNGLSEGLWDVVSTQNDILMTNKTGFYPILSIGQMIELLLTSGKYMFDLYIQTSVKEKSNIYDGWRNAEDGISDGEGTYLCDALFAAVKQVV